MDVELDVAELTSEEQEELDRIIKVEDGVLPIKEMPVRYYFENNHPHFPSLVVDYILDKHKVKTIGEFMEIFYDEVDNIPSIFPEYQDEGLKRQLDNDASEIMTEIFDAVEIG